MSEDKAYEAGAIAGDEICPVVAGRSFDALSHKLGEQLTAASVHVGPGASRPNSMWSPLNQGNVDSVELSQNRDETNNKCGASHSLNQGNPKVVGGRNRWSKIHSVKVRTIKKTKIVSKERIRSRCHPAVWNGTSLSASCVKQTEAIPPHTGDIQIILEKGERLDTSALSRTRLAEVMQIMFEASEIEAAIAEANAAELDSSLDESHLTGAPLLSIFVHGEPHSQPPNRVEPRLPTPVTTYQLVAESRRPSPGISQYNVNETVTESGESEYQHLLSVSNEEVMTGENSMRFDSGHMVLSPRCASGANETNDSKTECNRIPVNANEQMSDSKPECNLFPISESLFSPVTGIRGLITTQPLINNSPAECSMNMRNDKNKNISGPRGPDQMPQKRKTSAANTHELHLEQVNDTTSKHIGFNHLSYPKGEKAVPTLDLPGLARSPDFSGSTERFPKTGENLERLLKNPQTLNQGTIPTELLREVLTSSRGDKRRKCEWENPSAWDEITDKGGETSKAISNLKTRIKKRGCQKRGC